MPSREPSADAIAGLGSVAEPRWSPDGRRLGWVESGGGRADLVVASADGNGPRVVTAEVAADAAVAGVRGGTFAWVDARRFVYVARDGTVRVVDVDGQAGAVIVPRGRSAAPTAHPSGAAVAYVDDAAHACVIAVAPLDGSAAPAVVSRGADWSWDPAWSPDGARLAWHDWDFPAMPWDGGRIVVAAADGADPFVVAGGPDESVGQPRFAPAGAERIAFVSDRGGWANVRIASADGTAAARACSEVSEAAEPAWGPGQRSFAWSPDGAHLAWCRNEAGFGRLVVASAGDRAPRAISKGWHRWLDWGPSSVACVRSGARTVPAVTTIAAHDGARAVVATPAGAEAFGSWDAVEPEPITWTADDGATVHGLRYRARGAPHGGPLLVVLHGGPTDQSTADWDPRVQAFVARGWTVLAPNFRGSTGYGRAYRAALNGAWGARDVDDTITGIRAAVAEGWADPTRVALIGGSSGAFTALLVAIRAPELVRAVVASYPVTDLLALAADTHRFESRYSDVLIGALPAATATYGARSPIAHATALRVPVLVLHGLDDVVVPAAHVVSYVDAVRAAGGEVELQLYEGEGHGFSQPSTRADVFRRTEQFLTRRVLVP